MFDDHFPISPQRFPFFYGWVIVAVGTLGTLASIPGQTMGVSVFTDPLLDALSLSRTQLSLAYMVGTFTSGLFMLQGGRLLDRFGVRRMMVVASVCLGLSLLFMSVIGGVTGAVSRLFPVGLHTTLAMGIACLAFLCIRFFGQGLLALIPRVMVGRWFERRRGLAVGLQGVFVSFGFGYAPPFLNGLIEQFGWQGAYLALALVVGCGMSLVGWTFYREKPEDFGLMRDGAPIANADAKGEPSLFAAKREYTIEEARRTYIFWIYSFALASQGLVITAVTFHIVSLSESAGVSREQGLALFLPMALVNVLVNLTAGWISDKIRLKWLLLTMMAGQALGGYALLTFASPVARVLMVVGFGISGGLFGTLIGVAWPRFFGTTHLGAISGLNMSVMVLASSLGPILFGAFYDGLGSYDFGIIACVGLSLAIFLGGLWANNPQMKGS